MPQHLTLFRQDPHIEIGHEHDDLLVLVYTPHADVVKSALVPKRDGAPAVEASRTSTTEVVPR